MALKELTKRTRFSLLELSSSVAEAVVLAPVEILVPVVPGLSATQLRVLGSDITCLIVADFLWASCHLLYLNLL